MVDCFSPEDMPRGARLSFTIAAEPTVHSIKAVPGAPSCKKLPQTSNNKTVKMVLCLIRVIGAELILG